MIELLVILVSVSALLVVGFIYFLPSFIAHKRKHHNRNAILVLNLLLGFSFIGWVISLSWAFTKVDSSD